MAALRRWREIDQSTQRFHVGCDNRVMADYMDVNFSQNFNIYWVMARETPQKTVPQLVELPSSNLCVTSIGAAIFILTLNHADVIGDQSDVVTQNALCTQIYLLID